MSSNRTLVAYVSKGGVTEEYANVIANTLRDKYRLDGYVTNLKKSPMPELAKYANIVVGYGVRMGRPYKEAIKFIEKSDFSDMKVAIFVTSVEPRDEAISKYINSTLEKHPHLKPVATEVFGGRFKILGRTINDKHDPGRVKLWAEEIGKVFTS